VRGKVHSAGSARGAPRQGRGQFGKADEEFLEGVVYQSLGAARQDVLVGPRRGVDNAVVRIDHSRVMILTTDPISIIPSLGMETSAWLSAHLIASDFATSSRAPEFASFEYNIPRELSEADKAAYITAMGRVCGSLGVSIVAGHTGTYPGAGFTVIGGGTMFGFADENEYLDPSMSGIGDVLLMTKGSAIEATATLANTFPSYLEERIGSRLAANARQYTRLCTTVRDALIASSVGIGAEGVTSMHDATEGGVLGGLSEMAHASGNAFLVHEELIHVSEEARLTCLAFAIDPLVSLSEGTLLLTCREGRVGEVRRKLRRNGIPAFAIGKVAGRGSGLWSARKRGKVARLLPKRDRYWVAYARSAAENLT